MTAQEPDADGPVVADFDAADLDREAARDWSRRLNAAEADQRAHELGRGW